MSNIKEQIINQLIESLNEEFILQGHPNTGKFQESLRGEVIKEEGKEKILIWGLEYGIYLSEGVEADKIPYSRASGRGGTSKYMTGLKNWVQTKLGIADEREALSIAFAIAEKHSQEGMPVRGGKLGTGFIEEVRTKNKEKLNELAKTNINIMVNSELNKE